MILVAYAAAIAAALTPLVRGDSGLSRPVLLVVEGFALPMIVAVLSLVLVRRGPWKIFVVRLSAWLSYTVSFVLAATFLLVVLREGATVPLPLVAGIAAGALLIGSRVVLEPFRIAPRRCPRCGWWALLWERNPRLTRPYERRQCAACGARCRRTSGGPWEVADEGETRRPSPSRAGP